MMVTFCSQRALRSWSSCPFQNLEVLCHPTMASKILKLGVERAAFDRKLAATGLDKGSPVEATTAAAVKTHPLEVHLRMKEVAF